MKIWLPLLVMLCSSVQLFAQEYDTVPPYKKNPSVPEFQLLLSDSSWFESSSIPKDRPVVIIYFNSECNHCKVEAREISDSMSLLGLDKAFFIFVSYHDTPQGIKQYGQHTKLNKHKNVILGRDTTYNIPSFFRVRYTPFIAVYNKDQKLVQTFEGGVEASDLSALLKVL